MESSLNRCTCSHDAWMHHSRGPCGLERCRCREFQEQQEQEEKERVEKENILKEADRLIHGPRQASYSHPSRDFECTAKMWSALLMDKLKPGAEISAEDIGLCMIGLKLSRECRQHGRDNVVDIAGYAGCVEMIHDRREEQGNEISITNTSTTGPIGTSIGTAASTTLN